MGHSGDPAVGAEAKLKLEHFALSAIGRAQFEDVLRKGAIPNQCFVLDQIGIVQFHLRDPDGNHVHIDFALHE